MRQYIIYSLILIVGILLGWLLLANSSTKKKEHNHDTVLQTNQMWTCSMHPQITQPESGDCPICGMDLILAETSAVGLNPNEFKLTKNAMALANIQTSVVENSENKNATIQLSGKIAENEEQNVIQVSYFSGRIERLLINSTGEKVNKGQLLAEIYSPEVFAAQQELITTATIKNTQPELYKAVRNKLKLLKISEKQINQIEKTEKIITNFPIYATVSGTVSEKLIAQGATVNQGEPILKIAKDEPVFEMQQITLGNKIGDSYQILEGLFNGNEIVTNGTFTVDAAAQLQGKKSMMNRNKKSAITNHKGHLGIENEKITFESSIQKSFKTVIKAYLNLKDAFVTSDVSKITNESNSFRKSLDLISISEREKTHNY